MRQRDEWWRSNREARPALFARELARAVNMLAATPEIGPLHELEASDGVRRLLLRHTQFHIYYRYDRARDIVGVATVVAAGAMQTGPASSTGAVAKRA